MYYIEVWFFQYNNSNGPISRQLFELFLEGNASCGT